MFPAKVFYDAFFNPLYFSGYDDIVSLESLSGLAGTMSLNSVTLAYSSEDSGVPYTAIFSNSTLSLADDSSTTVVVTVYDVYGVPCPGVAITLSSTDDDLVSISPTSATTDSSGQVTITVTGKDPGSATISVEYTA